MRTRVVKLAYNRGLISRLGLARADIKRLAFAAEVHTNWMPRVLGSMMLRPGWQFIGESKANAQAVHVPFVFSVTDKALVEFTAGFMRVWIGDVLLSRVSVSSAVTNGNFTSDLTGWTDNDETGATSAFAAGGFMSLLGNSVGTVAAIRDQSVTVAAGDQNKEHALRIVVNRGPVTLRVGSTVGGDEYITETELQTGQHSLAFTPTGNFNIRFLSRLSHEVLVDSCNVEASGAVEIPSPYLLADLAKLRYDPSGDVIFIACPGYTQRRIERRATRSWSLVHYLADDGPFRVENTGPITIAASARTGTVTLTASAPLFRSSHAPSANNAGALFKLTPPGQQVSASVTAGNQFTSAIRVTGVGADRGFLVIRSGSWTGTVTLQRSLSSESGPWTTAATYTTNGTVTFEDGLNNQIAWYRIGIVTGAGLASTERANPKNFLLSEIVWSGSIFVAVGFADGVDAYLITSPDGITWTERANPKNFNLIGVTWNGSLFVAVGGADGVDAYIVTSPDGITWTERANPKNFNLHGVTWNGSIFVAVGAADGADAYLITSPDGITWTERANPKNVALNEVTWNGSIFVAVGAIDGATDAYLITSPDGITWTERANPKNFALLGIVWSGAIFVAVGGADGVDAYIVTSPDGITWTERANPKNFNLQDVTWNGSIFAAVGAADGTDAYLITSPDGIVWTERTNPKNFELRGVTGADSTIVSVGDADGADAYILTSTDSIIGQADLELNYQFGSITGVIRVSSFASSISVSGQVLKDLGGTTATDIWFEGEWSDYRGWPSAVVFNEGRLVWSGKAKIQESISDAFDSFDPDFEGDAGPINRTIGSGPVDEISWMLSLQRLILGGQGAEFSVRSSSLDEPVTPTNFNIKKASRKGSAAVAAVEVDENGIFVQRGGTRVYEIAFGQSGIDYESSHLSALVPDIGSPGIVKIAVQYQPDIRVHFIRSDGTAALLVFDKVEQVICWLEVETDGVIEDVAVLPGTTGDEEDLVYYSVKRTINAATKRYLEKWAFEEDCRGATLNKQADSFIAYNQAASSTISGLSHLEAKSVVVWDNGKCLRTAAGAIATFAVSGGQITVTNAGAAYQATQGVVGLQYTGSWKSAKLVELMETLGGSLTDTQMIKGLGLILADTHAKGLKYGQSLTESEMNDLPEIGDDGAPVAVDTVHTDYVTDELTFPGKWSRDARLCLLAKAPRPCTVLAALAEVEHHG